MDSSMSARLRPQAKSRIYSEEAWNAQKTNFTQLYESNTLKNAMLTMERVHGFCATERQYKRRIAKWRLDKNVKGAEMLTIIRKKVERKLVDGKDSAFCVRNRQVRSDKISRYEKRKKVSELETLLLNKEVVSDTPLGITCHTPPKDDSISSSHALREQHIPNGDSVADGSTPMDIDHEPGISQNSALNLYQQAQAVPERLIEACKDEIPVVVNSTPSRSIIQSVAMGLALEDMEASIPTLPSWEKVSRSHHVTQLSYSVIGDVAPEIPTCVSLSLLSNKSFSLGSDSAQSKYLSIESSVYSILGNGTAVLETDESLCMREKEYEQQVTTLRDELGHAHPDVLNIALKHLPLLINQRRYRFVSESLWQLAEARRCMIQSIDETTLEVVNLLMQLFSDRGSGSRWMQFLSFLIDCFIKASPIIDSGIYRRVEHLRNEISEIEQVKKVVMEHKQFTRFNCTSITVRDDIKSLDSVCMAIDDIINSAVAAA